ncbi:YciI family protein [Actinoplanes bogorensis]|uniref:YciI family protein n=1 Tax=Paractinoplanes bogorensis TaxID=1610840 RepID=A0ABS5YKK7_9ACTN|nr:YciI family protein [Actinoplanes bogorensis]MBU2664000.1 YciI family protein [Actinoplanes bogorensis]
MRYTLLFHYHEATSEELGAEAMEQGRQAMSSYAATLQAAGVLVGAEVLHRSDLSTTVQVRDGVAQVQDGPFADTKEQLGGTAVIDVADLDAAIDWAKQAPAAQWGTVEVRPGATYTVEGVWTPNK